MDSAELNEIRAAYALETGDKKHRAPRMARRHVVITGEDALHMAARIEVDVKKVDGAAHVVAAFTGVSLITARARVADATAELDARYRGKCSVWDVIVEVVNKI